MYSFPNDTLCPVRSLKLYLAKLSKEEDSFLQNPRKAAIQGDNEWYYGKLGVHTIDNMMKNISKKAGLSEIYTNHCIRATTSTILAHADVPHNDIIAVTAWA